MRERSRARMGETAQSGITTARLEQLFESLRSEVTTTVQPPVTAQAIRRTAGRRRRRRGAALGVACAVAAVGLWGVRGVVPGDTGNGVGASMEEHRISAEIPLPGPAVSDSSAVTDHADGQLFLPIEQLPGAEGIYGDWDLTGETSVFNGAAAGSATPQPPSGASAACLAQAVGDSAAAVVLGRSYKDGTGHGATAAQYVLVFPSEQEASRAAGRLQAPADCGAGAPAVTALGCADDVTVLRTEQSGVVVEEVTVQRAGVRVVAMDVHRVDASRLLGSAPPSVQETGLQPEFSVAAAALRARVAELSSPDGSVGPSSSAAGAATEPDAPSPTPSPTPASSCEPVSAAPSP